MSAMPHLRSPEEADHAELEAMILALYREDSPGEPMDSSKIRRTVATLAARPERGCVRLIELQGQCIGYLILIHYWSNEYGGDLVAIDELFLRPPWRGRGLGRAVIEQVVQDLPADAVGVQLEVSPCNTKAAAFYRALGFQPMRNQPLLRRR